MKTHYSDFMQKDLIRSSFSFSTYTENVRIYSADGMIMQTMKLASSYSYSQLFAVIRIYSQLVSISG